jgi:predicted HD phosphohydrolase
MFTTMLEGTREDWATIAGAHMQHQVSDAPRQILESLARLEAIEVGFGANQLVHSLMTATLARRDGAGDQEVVAALCHDLGKLMSIPNHGAIAAEILKPYVSDDIYHAVKHHQDFQGRYYYEFLGKDAHARDRFKDEPWYDFAEKLVDRWDAPAFDPAFDVDSLASFEPEVTRVFSRPIKAY